MDDRALYQRLLGLEAPWMVSDVELRLSEGDVVLRVEPEVKHRWSCPVCSRECAGYDTSPERRWRHLDTFQYRTILVARLPRIDCPEHGVRQVSVPWAEPGSRFTMLFEAVAITLLRETTVSGLARLMRISWHEASGILHRAVRRGLARREQEPVRVFGVDETSFQKRFEYITVVADVERSRVLWVGDARRQETLGEFWNTLSDTDREAVDAVVMDLWDPYIAATREAVGAEAIVFDRFHVVKQLTAAVDEVRRAEQRHLTKLGQRERARALKGTRFLWTRGRHRRSAEEEARIRELQDAGHEVGRAWALKEMALELWNCTSLDQARAYFETWAYQVEASALAPMKKAAKTLRRYLYGILAFLEKPYTNALSESLNAKIQEIKYRARGYRNRDNFKLAIYFHCGDLDLDPR